MRKERVSKNKDAFAVAKQERTQSTFYKFVQIADLSSEKMREIPQDLISELNSFKMVLRVTWGMSWEVELLKNPRFCYMEKRGWEKFVNDNALGESELLTFTHQGNMSFTVNIFQQNGKEITKPRLAIASSSGIKTEQGNVSNHIGTGTAESTGAAKSNHGLNLGKKNNSLGSSSSSAPQFTVVIQKSYLYFILVPKYFVKSFKLPTENTMFTIHHPDGKRSWEVEYAVRKYPCKSNQCYSTFSRGFTYLAREYPLEIGDSCWFTLTSPTAMLLVVSKAGEETP